METLTFTRPITLMVLGAFVLGVPYALYLAYRFRANRFALAALIALLVVVAATFATTGFPTYHVAFGAVEELSLVVVAFAGIVVGILAHASYYQRGKKGLTVGEFLKPLLISPLLLAPLVGVMQTTGFEVLKMVSLFILAFQNGFFWKEVLQNVRLSPA